MDAVDCSMERFLSAHPALLSVLDHFSIREQIRFRQISPVWRDAIDRHLSQIQVVNVPSLLGGKSKDRTLIILEWMSRKASGAAEIRGIPENIQVGAEKEVLEVLKGFQNLKILDLTDLIPKKNIGKLRMLSPSLEGVVQVMELLETTAESLQDLSLNEIPQYVLKTDPLQGEEGAVVLERLKAIFGRLEELQSLTFHDHNDHLLQDLLVELPRPGNLKRLNFAVEMLTPPVVRILQKFLNLKELRIREKAIENLPRGPLAETFSQMKALESLDSDKTYLSVGCVEQLGNLRRWRALAWALPANDIPWTNFHRLQNLELVGLSLQSHLGGIAQLKSLKTLRLHLEPERAALTIRCDFSQLEVLDLEVYRGSPFRHFPKPTFKISCPSLTHLRLQSRHLEEFTTIYLSQTHGIRQIRISCEFSGLMDSNRKTLKRLVENCSSMKTMELLLWRKSLRRRGSSIPSFLDALWQIAGQCSHLETVQIDRRNKKGQQNLFPTLTFVP